MQDRQQHELFEGHIRDPAVKKRLESVGENEQHAEDSPPLSDGSVGKPLYEFFVRHALSFPANEPLSGFCR